MGRVLENVRRQEEEFFQVRKVIKYMSERQGKLFAMMDSKRNLMIEAPKDLRRRIFQEITDLDGKISEEEVQLLERKRILEEMSKEGRNAEVEEGRVTVTAGGGVTLQPVAGSRMDVRRGTEETVAAESGFTPKAAAGSQSAGTEGNLPSVEESGRRESKGTDEVVAVGGGQSSEMECDFLRCGVGGHPKNTEGQKPLSLAIAPQKRRAVIRVELAETQDYVSVHQLTEEENGEEMGKLSRAGPCTYRVASIYGPGCTIYTPFLKKCATIYGLNTAFSIKK